MRQSSYKAVGNRALVRVMLEGDDADKLLREATRI